MSGLSRYGAAGDVRAFYAALGIPLPAREVGEAAVSCFADSEAHRGDDRHPSCSISLLSGAFHCHGCGARGGAYDAALLCRRTPRQAIDLMVEHGLTERREPGRARRRSGRAALGPPAPPPRHTPPPAQLAVTANQVDAWHQRLASDSSLLAELGRERAWTREAILRHRVGWDGRRIVFPCHDANGLQAVYRYAPPHRRRGPKTLAMPGSRRALFPALDAIVGPDVWLTEGQPDALAGQSAGLPATGIPGVWGWEPQWAERFRDRRIVICMDVDTEGRAAARRIARSLLPVAAEVRILTLAHDTEEGFDLTDALHTGDCNEAAQRLLAQAAALPPLGPADT